MTIQERISLALENLLTDIYNEKGIETGDITPFQLMQWNDLTKETATLFAELIEQNKGENN